MERNFPKNVKQIGNISDTPKVYVEDYVDTFLNQLTDTEGELVTGAFLTGERVTLEEKECVFVTGAVKMRELDREKKEPEITKDYLEIAKLESREYFDGKEIVGWYFATPDRPVTLTNQMTKIHEELFPEKNSLFLLKDGGEEMQVYAYKFHDLMKMGGYCIFYEKNPDMQNYMINERRQIGVTPSEVVEDRAAKDFRNTIKGRIELKEQRRESRYVYLTSVLLVVVVLAIGISTMNNYDKINSVQTSIETLSEVMQKDEADTEKVIPEEEAAVTEEDVEVSGQAVSGTEDMEPQTSTIQEELGDAEYYIVQRGDTLDTISEKIYGTTLEADAICKMNGLEDGNLIFIGQKLLLP